MALEMDATARKSQMVLTIAAKLESSDFYIYQGTPPANANDYSSAARSSDLLTTFAAADLYVFTVGPADNGAFSTTGLSTPTATATGTATWFAAFESSWPSVVMTGTVGSTGTGADFELIDASLVSGNPVNFASFEHSVS